MAETWTADDATAIRDAIRKLVTGQRVVTIAFGGPPARSVTYQMAQLLELRSLLAEINRAIGASATPRLAATSKGLGRGGGL